jgi:uracil-DNA glycosylase family protein
MRGHAQDSAAAVATDIVTLETLRTAEAACTRCPLHLPATQVVPGEGPALARLMFVGEQPGNDEDLRGRPFVGPAGRVFDRALGDAGLDRKQVFVTNAVKHFKFEQRGKRRLHKRPNSYEIERCRWWIDIETAIVKPALVVALGATAARSLIGKSVSISSVRGAVMELNDGMRLFVTIHPSYLLRILDADDKAREYQRFVEDLRACERAVGVA